MLAENRIAELDDGALKMRYFRLDPFQRVILSRGQCLAP